MYPSISRYNFSTSEIYIAFFMFIKYYFQGNSWFLANILFHVSIVKPCTTKRMGSASQTIFQMRHLYIIRTDKHCSKKQCFMIEIKKNMTVLFCLFGFFFYLFWVNFLHFSLWELNGRSIVFPSLSLTFTFSAKAINT